MKKLVLSIDQLQVESYQTTTSDAAERGTVFGNLVVPASIYTNDFTCRGSACPNPSGAVRCF